MTGDFILSNTFAQIERGVRELGDIGTRFEFECYDVGHLYNLAPFRQPRTSEAVLRSVHLRHSRRHRAGPRKTDPHAHHRDKLFGDDYYLSVLGAGRHQMPFVTMSAIMDGNVRVGLEDNPNISRGEFAASNAEQVAKIRRILEDLSLEIATADEARAMLQTKGRANVGF